MRGGWAHIRVADDLAKRVAVVLAAIIAALVAASLAAHLLRFGFGLTSQQTGGFITIFDLNEEGNVPTWFSSMMLAGCAVLLALIAFARASTGDRWTRHWAVLGAIFVLLSVDEVAAIHERTQRPIQLFLELAQPFPGSWVLVGIPVVMVFLAIYLRFIWHLRDRWRWLFVISGGIYVTGAIGIEILSGLTKFQVGAEDIRYGLITTFEETVEMLGIMLFIYALVGYVAREDIVWKCAVAARRRDAEADVMPAWRAPHAH